MGAKWFLDRDDHDTDVGSEAIACATTFLAMAYIIVVNPTVLSNAISIEGYSDPEVFQMIAITTILASVAAMLVMALYANRPFGLAPGLGLNAFFAFTVVLGLGIPWQTALAAVFVEGIIFIVLTAIGAREYIINLFPEPVKFAVGAGIGVFLLFIGLQEFQVIVNDEATLVAWLGWLKSGSDSRTVGRCADAPVVGPRGDRLDHYRYPHDRDRRLDAHTGRCRRPWRPCR